MSININHNNSGNITLQASNETGCSVLTFPSFTGESTILLSGIANVSSISGLNDCLSNLGISAFSKVDAYAQEGALVQRTSGNTNYASCAYSLALGNFACANRDYQIAQAIPSDGVNCGWRQSNQFLFKASTTGAEVCSVVDCFSIGGYDDSISYINGKAIAKGNNKYAAFDFCMVRVGNCNDSAVNPIYINTGISMGGNFGFVVELDAYGSGQKLVALKVIGEENTSLNWLICVNQLYLRNT